MAQYIDKDALVADILHFIDTLEVKEVDLETHGKELMYAIQKTGERTKREVINKACEYLSETLMDNRDNCGYNVVSSFDTITLSEYIENFKKAVGE